MSSSKRVREWCGSTQGSRTNGTGTAHGRGGGPSGWTRPKRGARSAARDSGVSIVLRRPCEPPALHSCHRHRRSRIRWAGVFGSGRGSRQRRRLDWIEVHASITASFQSNHIDHGGFEHRSCLVFALEWSEVSFLTVNTKCDRFCFCFF